MDALAHQEVRYKSGFWGNVKVVSARGEGPKGGGRVLPWSVL